MPEAGSGHGYSERTRGQCGGEVTRLDLAVLPSNDPTQLQRHLAQRVTILQAGFPRKGNDAHCV